MTWRYTIEESFVHMEILCMSGDVDGFYQRRKSTNSYISSYSLAFLQKQFLSDCDHHENDLFDASRDPPHMPPPITCYKRENFNWVPPKNRREPQLLRQIN